MKCRVGSYLPRECAILNHFIYAYLIHEFTIESIVGEFQAVPKEGRKG